MDNNPTTNQEENTADSSNTGENTQTKTFSQEEVNDIVRNRVNEVNKKQDEKVKVAVAEAIKEYERQAKLSAEEKVAEETKKRQAELEQKEHDLLIRENRATAREYFQEKGISLELLDNVVDPDLDVTKQKIAKFEKAWNKAVEEGVNRKVASKTMTDPASSKKIEDKTSTRDLLYN